MSRNTLIIAGLAVVVLIALFVVFSGGTEDATEPTTGTVAPATE